MVAEEESRKTRRRKRERGKHEKKRGEERKLALAMRRGMSNSGEGSRNG